MLSQSVDLSVQVTTPVTAAATVTTFRSSSCMDRMAAYGAYNLHVGCMQGREPWPREARPSQCFVTILTYSLHIHLESASIRDHVHWPGPREAQPQFEAINRVSAYVYVSAF